MPRKSNKPYYKSRSKDGQEVQYDTPAELLAQAYRYFDWCADNPCRKSEALKSGAVAGTIIEIPVARPFTLTGFCVFSGISEKTFAAYEVDEEFRTVTDHIKEIIRQNQLEGACAGIYSQTVVSRMLELTERQEITMPSGLVINVTSADTKTELDKLRSTLSQE